MKYYLVEVLPDSTLKNKLKIAVFDFAIFYKLEDAIHATKIYDKFFEKYPEVKVQYDIQEIESETWWRMSTIRACEVVRGARSSWKPYPKQTLAQMAEKFKEHYPEDGNDTE